MKAFTFLLILAWLIPLASPVNATPSVEDTGYEDVPPPRRTPARYVPLQQRKITLRTGGGVVYHLSIRIVKDPGLEGTPPKNAKIIGDSSGRTTGWAIGVEGGKGAWYGQGTFGFLLGNRLLTDGLPDELTTGADDDAAWMRALWKTSGGDVTATFLARKDDDKLFMQLRHEEESGNVSIRLLSLPGHVHAESKLPEERWISTSSRNLNTPTGEAIPFPENDDWALIFDRHANHFRGACAFLFDREEIVGASVRLGTAVSAMLPLRPGQRAARLILWNYDEHYRSPEEAYDELKRHSEPWLKELRAIDFNRNESDRP